MAFFVNPEWQPGSRAFEERAIEFTWYLGMAVQQRQRSIASLHESIREQSPDATVLEVSTKSTDQALGRSLSAFSLSLNGYPVENIFQSAKVMSDGGPHLDLLRVDPREAKRDCRIQTAESKADCATNGVKFTSAREFYDDANDICPACRTRRQRRLSGFQSKVFRWPLEPRSVFYDALYMTALVQPENRALTEKIGGYSAFTDIAFNQKTPYASDAGPFNCQARSCAIYATLASHGMEHDAIAELAAQPSEMLVLYDPGAQEPETLWQ